MAEIKDYSTTAGSNNGAGDAGMPENMPPSSVNNAWREGIARMKRWYEDTNAVNSLAGGTTAYTLAASRTISAYAVGDVFLAVCNATNTGASTLNVDSVGAKSIVDTSNVALGAGDLVINGIYWFGYDATNDTFICLNPATGGSAAFDINGLPADTVMADADVIAFYDDDEGANNKITIANAQVELALSSSVSFRAQLAANQTGLTNGSWITIQAVDTETDCYDYGGNYANASTYAFTAPADGLYAFWGNILFDTQLGATIVPGGRFYNSTDSQTIGRFNGNTTSSAAKKTLNGTAVSFLSASDVVIFQVKQDESSLEDLDVSTAESGFTYWSGTRIA